MRNLILFLSLFSLLACKNESPEVPTVDLTLRVKGTFNGIPLQMYNKDYEYTEGVNIRFQLFNFYLSDLYLLKESGSTQNKIRLSEVVLINFKDIQSPADSEKGVQFVFKDIPVDNYVGFSAGVGVAPRLNATGPASYPPPHPLDDNYWSWAAGYVFSKIEGNADIDNSGKFATKLTFHAGGDAFYKVLTWNKPLSVNKESSEINMTIDVKDILWKDQQNYLDFKKITSDHSVNKEIVSFLLSNLQQGLQIR
jgi:hypothetical protein